MLDADMALTKSFRGLCDVSSAWTIGDGLAASAAVRAAIALAELIAEEERGGDVMLAIQTERLDTLSILLETALDTEVESKALHIQQLGASVRSILDSHTFPPMIGLRHPDLPPIHRPLLRILHLLLQSAFTGHISADLSMDLTIEAAGGFALEAADVVLDAISRGKIEAETHDDLGQIIGVLCEVTRSPALIWLDQMAEHNLLSRSLEVVVRSRINNGRLHGPLSDVLMLHLSLASHSASAEKLSVSGILPAYSDNAIAVEAEHGRILPSLKSIHDAWCSMLLVIRALISNLPEADIPGFIRSDVIPFLRVCTAQLLCAMNWDGETPFTQAAMDELELVTDIFYSVSKAVGSTDGLFHDFATPALGLLTNLRHVLSHPRLLSMLIVPSTEEEHASLEKELADEAKEVELLNFAASPVIARRTAGLMRVARTVLVSLVFFTRAWDTARGDEAKAEMLLTPEASVTLLKDGILAYRTQGHVTVSVSDDPIGVINDIYLLSSSLLDRSPFDDSSAESRAARQVAVQITESSALLSTSQLIIRQSLLEPVDSRLMENEGMDVDSGEKRRVSLGKMGAEGRTAHVLRELVGDLRGMLPVNDALNGERGMLAWLRGVADKAFGSD